MVRRRVLISAGLALLAAGAAAPSARAADAKVAIGHYRWTPQVVHVDLGQKVTWYWVGPDTMHSVTGISPNDLGDDSDPGSAIPHHKLGSTYSLTFTAPGDYFFHCKMHPIVHGEVIVSDFPGNPDDNPDPTPKLNVTLLHPTITDLALTPATFTTRGTTLHWALDDPASLDAEIWHVSHGHRGAYAGWETLRGGHIGFNVARFATPGPHFRPAPGRYVAYLQATDLYHNVSPTRRIEFTIAAPRRARHHHLRMHHRHRMRMVGARSATA